MLAKFFAAVEKSVELPLKHVEKRIAELSPSLKLSDVPSIVMIAILTSLSAWLLFYAEGLLFRLILAAFPSLESFLESFGGGAVHATELVLYIFALLTVPLAIAYRVKAEHKKQKSELVDDLYVLKLEVREVAEILQQAREQQGAIAETIFRQGLLACRSEEPFKNITDSLVPGNKHLAERLETLRKDTVERLALVERLTVLPVPARNALADFLRPTLNEEELEKSWIPLYLTFAIQLQLAPWIRNNRTPRYVFIRDIDELIDTGSDLQAAFQYSLEEDLRTILSFVNGSLISVVFRDLDVWARDAYYDSNEDLLVKLRSSSSINLMRLFVYEKEWLVQPTLRNALERSARWHKDKDYPCRFIKLSENMGPIIELGISDQSDYTFISSCCFADTRIQMYQSPTEGEPRRYKYLCNADPYHVTIYKQTFRQVWDHAQSAESFLRLLGGSDGRGLALEATAN